MFTQPAEKKERAKKALPIRKSKEIATYLLYWLSFIYFEILLITMGRIDLSAGKVCYIALFSMVYASVLYIITSMPFSRNVNFILQTVFLFLITLFYEIEFYSRAFFRNYMSVESIFGGGKGIFTDFADETFAFVSSSPLVFFLLLIPLILLTVLNRVKLISSESSGIPLRLICVGMAFLFFGSGVAVVYDNDNDKKQYLDNYEFDAAALRFGVATSVRLEIERFLTEDEGAGDFEFDFDEIGDNAADVNKDFELPEYESALAPELDADGDGKSGNIETYSDKNSVSAGTEENTENTGDGSSVGSNATDKNNSGNAGDDNTGNNGSSGNSGNSNGNGDNASKNEAAGKEDAENENQSDEEPAVKEYGRHEIDVDFAALSESESDKHIASLHKYVASGTPSSENEYTGIFEGKNLIFITAEALSKEAIREDLFPTLYRFATKGINFTNYYQPIWGGSTSTGEYSNMTGLIPAYGIGSMKRTIGKNMAYTIGNRLKDLSYFTRAYHDHDYSYYGRNDTHENLGYEKYIGRGNGLEDKIKGCWPESDLEMMQATIDDYIDNQPFSIYYMSVSGHTNYNWGGNSMSKKNKEAVADFDETEPVKAYLAANLELEYALEYLLERLEEAGIAEDTVIVIGADHYPFGLEGEKSENFANALGDLYGYDYKDQFERDHNRLIIWSKCLEDKDPIIVDEPTYSLDIVPTLANLFGLKFDSRLYVGRDVFSDAEPLVIWANYSWMTDKAVFNSGRNKLTVFEGCEEEVTDEYVKKISSKVSNFFTFSKNAIEYNYYEYLFTRKE